MAGPVEPTARTVARHAPPWGVDGSTHAALGHVAAHRRQPCHRRGAVCAGLIHSKRFAHQQTPGAHPASQRRAGANHRSRAGHRGTALAARAADHGGGRRPATPANTRHAARPAPGLGGCVRHGRGPHACTQHRRARSRLHIAHGAHAGAATPAGPTGPGYRSAAGRPVERGHHRIPARHGQPAPHPGRLAHLERRATGRDRQRQHRPGAGAGQRDHHHASIHRCHQPGHPGRCAAGRAERAAGRRQPERPPAVGQRTRWRD